MVELVLVIIVIGILFVAFVSKTDSTTEKAKIAGVQTDFRSFYTALKAVGLENQLYTLSDDEFEDLLNANLDKQLQFKNGICKWKDPWGEPYAYSTFTDDKQKTRYIMFASKGGRDSIELGIEDIARADSDEMNITMAVKQVDTQFCGMTTAETDGMTEEELTEVEIFTNLKDEASFILETNGKWNKDVITAEDFDEDEKEIYAYLVNGDTLVLRNSPRKKMSDVTKTYGKLNSSHARNWGADVTLITMVNIETPILPKICRGWFSECRNLIKIRNIDYMVTDSCTDMRSMFAYCNKLTSIDVSNFNTSNINSTNWMFFDCQSLTSLDLSDWNISKVTSAQQMFSGCKSLTSIELSNLDTSNITNMREVFYDCQNLTSLDLSIWKTSKVTTMCKMFAYCYKLNLVNAGSWDTSKVSDMSYMFFACSSLTELNITSFTTSGNTNERSMFNGCTNLKKIYVNSTFKTSGYLTEYMFMNCWAQVIRV